MRGVRRWTAWGVIVTAGCALAAARRPAIADPQAAPSPTASPSPSPAPEPSAPASLVPDLEISATVHFRSLRFDAVGQPKVEFTGQPERETIWRAERENLPTPVQPGVTYPDGAVRLTISSRFADLARLFSEPGAPAATPSPSPSPGPSPSPAAERLR